MSIFNIITLIFVVLKLTNYIDWSWWLVLTPAGIFVTLWLAVSVWWESKSTSEKLQWKLRIK